MNHSRTYGPAAPRLPAPRAITSVLTAWLLASVLSAGTVHAEPLPAQKWQQTVASTGLQVSLSPAGGRVNIGKFQQWTVQLIDAQGKPVYPARIGINGGMPGHGHGLPTQPQVTDYLGDGRYLIEGMKLNMAGDWILLLGIHTPTTRQQVQFEFSIDF